MARPPPTLIASHTDGAKCTEVCEADAVYAVLYQGQAIKIRTHCPELRYQGYKYGKSMFPEAGHALRLARRLNAAHNTQDFSVGIMTVKRVMMLGEND